MSDSRDSGAAGVDAAPVEHAYQSPRLEHLGRWRALTLQQTVPIGPGGFLLDPERPSRLG